MGKTCIQFLITGKEDEIQERAEVPGEKDEIQERAEVPRWYMFYQTLAIIINHITKEGALLSRALLRCL